ncbi:hypothetical protein T4A_4282 [Trichinella pseudospiralis]|uniref:Uncharacterized protein n=1 Tax=Trichinella pseudospiralis TaxID=6337 RepID=A0A0V1EHX8_TRIPS|nr:hypothetical protein T4A_4282 [Trichinella pseudospiralis]
MIIFCTRTSSCFSGSNVLDDLWYTGTVTRTELSRYSKEKIPTYKLLIQWFFLCPGQLMVKFGVYSAATLPDNIYAFQDYIATVTDQLGTKSLPADCVARTALQGSALSKYTSLESGKPQKPDSLRQRPPAQPKGTKKVAYANLTQPGGKYCAIICQGHSPKRYANFFYALGRSRGRRLRLKFQKFRNFGKMSRGIAWGVA